MVTIRAAKERLFNMALLQNQNQPSVCTDTGYLAGFSIAPKVVAITGEKVFFLGILNKPV